MGRWLAGIAAAVIAGLIVWWITEQNVQSPPAPPKPPVTRGPQNVPKPPIYDPYQSFMSAAISPETKNPLSDTRVTDAIELVLRGEDISKGKRLMFAAGWPNGFSLNLLMSKFKKFGGSEGEADLLIKKLSVIGIRVKKIP